MASIKILVLSGIGIEICECRFGGIVLVMEFEGINQ
jgi:hypothetical protein